MKNNTIQTEVLNEEELLFVNDIKGIAFLARKQAYRSANQLIVLRNWLIGCRIVEQEQHGMQRAEYGKRVLEIASASLSREFGKGFGVSNIKNFRQFYLTFKGLQIRQTLSGEFELCDAVIRQTASGELSIPYYPNLSWSHYEDLMRVSDVDARLWYMKEAASCQWDVRTLHRNISSQYYYRLLQTPEEIRQEVECEMRQKTQDFESDKLNFLKNPIVAEFLGLPSNYSFSESKLENAIIDHLQKFIMELGKGYAFVARQQHVRTDMGDFYIDLVFYNIVLKCYLIIDLKTSQITHQDVGQMDMYIRMYDELKKEEDNNPTIGLLLCADTSADLARYSILKESKQLFAAKYLTYLPSEEVLAKEIKEQRKFFELQSAKINASKE